MKLTPDKMDKFKDKTCFMCGKKLLDYTPADLAYVPNVAGKSIKATPTKYYLFPCPECNQVAHKRCWYKHGEKKHKKGFFSTPDFRLECPSCARALSQKREGLVDWRNGYQIPGHPDDTLIEVQIADVISWKRGRSIGSFLNMVGDALNTFFQAVGLGSLTDTETSAVAKAAQKIGKGINDVAEKVFKLDITPEDRKNLTELKCQNCDAPLPLPEYYVEAVVCDHCGTAHLLPT
ncbi:MAG: hypothetical protein P1Q69_18645 [Candidatus Thorarchaeota archaeon]|nr:hypothetical protein [Candidatus Thorarchaeota archaeon]